MSKIYRKRFYFPIRQFSCVFVLLLLGVFVSACSSAKKLSVSDTSIQTAGMLNPNINNTKSPVELVFYQLTSKDKFEQASFQSLYGDASKTLGKDLLDKQSLMVKPGVIKQFKFKLLSDTNYVGVVAAFRKINEAQWRDVRKIDASSDIKLNVIVGTLSVTIKK